MPELGPSASWNSTYNGAVFVNSIDGGTMLMIVICIIGAIALFLLITSLERYTKFFDAIAKLLSTLRYTAFGVGISAAGYGFYLVCNFIARAGSGIDPIWIAEAVGVYIVLTVIGYSGERIYHRIKTMHLAYTESRNTTLTEVKQG